MSMARKFGVLDILVILLLIGSLYVYQNKETYFEIKSSDIIGSAATYYTLHEKGLCADARVTGYLPDGELEIVSGKVVGATRAKIYIFDGGRVWVVGGEEVVVAPRLFTEEIIPSDIVPLTITMRASECEWNVEHLYTSFDGLKGSGGLLSFHGVADTEMEAAEAFWVMRRVAEETSGEVYVWLDGSVLHVYARYIVPADLFIIEKYIPGMLVSDAYSTRVR